MLRENIMAGRKGRAFVLSVALPLASAFLTGCGGEPIYPVQGRVVWKETGAPAKELQGGSVEFESEGGEKVASARGDIDAEGNFRLTTKTPGDGAFVGKHKVVVAPPEANTDLPQPKVLAPKYRRPDTSGLTATVEAKENTIDLTVSKK